MIPGILTKFASAPEAEASQCLIVPDEVRRGDSSNTNSDADDDDDDDDDEFGKKSYLNRLLFESFIAQAITRKHSF